MTSEAELIARTLEGEKEAFGELIERHQARLFGNLQRLTGDSHATEDLVQDAFVQAYVRLSQFEGRSAFYTWICRIAMNLWLGQKRRKQPQSLEAIEGGSDRLATDRQSAPEAPLERAEEQALVRRGLQALSEEHREVLMLREFDELDYESIAKTLRVPIGTVRSRLGRARHELRLQLRAWLAPASEGDAIPAANRLAVPPPALESP